MRPPSSYYHLKQVYRIKYTSTVYVFTFCFPPSEPGPVNDLNVFFTAPTMFNSTSRMLTVDINISWNVPTFPNGIITNYDVIVLEMDTDIVVYSNDSVLDPIVTESVMVLPFTNYTVTVAASTSAGQGVETTIIVLSNEAGTCRMLYNKAIKKLYLSFSLILTSLLFYIHNYSL